MIAIESRHLNLRQLPARSGPIGANTVSLTTIRHKAFNAGYWEQTVEGLNREREDLNVHSQKTN